MQTLILMAMATVLAMVINKSADLFVDINKLALPLLPWRNWISTARVTIFPGRQTESTLCNIE